MDVNILYYFFRCPIIQTPWMGTCSEIRNDGPSPSVCACEPLQFQYAQVVQECLWGLHWRGKQVDSGCVYSLFFFSLSSFCTKQSASWMFCVMREKIDSCQTFTIWHYEDTIFGQIWFLSAWKLLHVPLCCLFLHLITSTNSVCIIII